MGVSDQFSLHVVLILTSISEKMAKFQVIMMQSSQEKLEKVLPFQLSQIPDIFTFTQSPVINTDVGFVDIFLEGTE